jgi:hypothetical protein
MVWINPFALGCAKKNSDPFTLYAALSNLLRIFLPSSQLALAFLQIFLKKDLTYRQGQCNKLK